jgi:Domain of unknown function (DUF4410)
MRLRLTLLYVSILCFCVALSAQTPGGAPTASAAAAQPAAVIHNLTKNTPIYVSDFDLDAQNVAVDQGGPVSQARPGILERPRKREQKDPEAQAKKLVDTMSKSLVEDLQKAGYKAQRLAPGQEKPTSGAWVHGVFTEADEGNRMHRAMIGFGSGEAKMELQVTLTDLAAPEKPLYTEATDNTSAKKMGAVITMNPYVAAAKFVMEKNAPEKTVKKTAGEISAEIVNQFKQASSGQ